MPSPNLQVHHSEHRQTSLTCLVDTFSCSQQFAASFQLWFHYSCSDRHHQPWRWRGRAGGGSSENQRYLQHFYTRMGNNFILETEKMKTSVYSPSVIVMYVTWFWSISFQFFCITRYFESVELQSNHGDGLSKVFVDRIIFCGSVRW